jgi:hypothetical protein
MAIAACLPPFIVLGVMPVILFPALNIVPGGKQEMLAIPFQQTALLVKKHKDDIPEKDLETIYKVLGKDVSDKFQWWASDKVKGYSWDSSKDQYLGDFMKIWIREGLEYPGTYLEAYTGLQESWMGWPNAQDKKVDQLLMPVYVQGNNHDFLNSDKMGLTNQGSPTRAQAIEHQISWFERSAFGMLVFSRVFWSTWMVFFVVYESLRRGKKRSLIMLPYVTTYILLWISPATVTIEGMRYLLPMIFVAPLMLGTLFNEKPLSNQKNIEVKLGDKEVKKNTVTNTTRWALYPVTPITNE